MVILLPKICTICSILKAILFGKCKTVCVRVCVHACVKSDMEMNHKNMYKFCIKYCLSVNSHYVTDKFQ